MKSLSANEALAPLAKVEAPDLEGPNLEIVMLQNNFLVGGRLDSRDRFSDWRLDIDSMSYEQLLELGEKIGHVNTGLKEDEISRCLRKMKGSVMNDLPVSVNMNVDRKCSICQPSYIARRTVNSETLSFLDSDSAFISSRPEPDFFGSRYYRHARHPSPEGLAEVCPHLTLTFKSYYEEYEANEEMGKLYCGHSFHIQCIKQWLVHKNTCPVCKTEATAQC
ncbi:hypothetical protein GOBAR_AA21310 [Gossypium barbadense]|uniref:RING-type E3 ubiquitin transferase n=1 Tax=Gossypium barbadense TaxID=3634 RepID=A0A2P5X7Q4_GOSBA|nr:hypothetical protein GOBAR_AA21310 [Gossypium barbadense]